MGKLTRILSIDGGGIRGILPGQVLIHLEEKLQEKSGNKNGRIADYFDLIAGTSTGGILTCLYLAPENGKPKFSAREAVDLYLKRGGDIFDISLLQKVRSMAGLIDERYDAKPLEAALSDYLSDLKLSDLLKPCLITAYNIEKRKAEFMTQHDAKQTPEKDYYIRDVARATSAAPTYFETARIESMGKAGLPLVDGGVFANNPALCAYAEARTKMETRPTAKDMVILSLGTGFMKKQYPYDKAKDWGAIEWIRPVIDIMMTGVAETVDYQLRRIYDAVERPQQYLRINGELEKAKHDLDDASPENLQALSEDGIRIAERFDKELDAFIEHLLD